jgi:hypothetical protein
MNWLEGRSFCFGASDVRSWRSLELMTGEAFYRKSMHLVNPWRRCTLTWPVCMISRPRIEGKTHAEQEAAERADARLGDALGAALAHEVAGTFSLKRSRAVKGTIGFFLRGY